MSSATLQDDPSVETLFDVAKTETLALFEHLCLEFLEEFDAFAPAGTPEAASTHELRCSSRCAFASSSLSPTTNEETIQEVP